MTATSKVGPDGYRLILPEGWVRLNVRDPIEATVADVLAQIRFDDLPRDERARRRVAIEGRLRVAVENAKKVDAYALYLPLMGMHGLAVPASFIIAAATDFSVAADDEAVLDQLACEANADRVILDGADAVRTASVSTSVDEQSGLEVGGQQVVYTVRVPDSAEWLVSAFDVVTSNQQDEDYEAFVQALVSLFDGIMSTFRWTFSER